MSSFSGCTQITGQATIAMPAATAPARGNRPLTPLRNVHRFSSPSTSSVSVTERSSFFAFSAYFNSLLFVPIIKATVNGISPKVESAAIANKGVGLRPTTLTVRSPRSDHAKKPREVADVSAMRGFCDFPSW